MELALPLAKTFVSVAIFFVWVVRYDNIIKEFKQYSLPDWTRDLVGILKLSFAYLIITASGDLLRVGAGGIAALMIGALIAHVRVKNPVHKMLPALCLLSLSCYILFSAQ